MTEDRRKYFIELVYQNIGIILKICNIYCNEHEREDMKQEIIYQLWKSFPTFRGNSGFQTWMYRVALNTALLSLRREKPGWKKIGTEEYQIPDRQPDESDHELKIKQLYDCIATLNNLDKTITFLYMEKCSYQEISGITGINEKNVSVRLVRIKKKLRKLLDNG